MSLALPHSLTYSLTPLTYSLHSLTHFILSLDPLTYSTHQPSFPLFRPQGVTGPKGDRGDNPGLPNLRLIEKLEGRMFQLATRLQKATVRVSGLRG